MNIPVPHTIRVQAYEGSGPYGDAYSAHLAAAGIGTWRDAGIYQPGETGIVICPQTPDRMRPGW